MRFFALAILFIIMTAMRFFKLGGVYDDPLARTMIGFGFLIFTGMAAGKLAARIALPRITGYLLAGMICGPYILGLIDHDVAERLRTVDDLALALIAFTAGGELRIARLKKAGMLITTVAASQIVFAFALGMLATFAVALVHKQFAQLPLLTLASLSIFFGLAAAANSPATVVAVIVDTGSHGPLADQALGVTILKDIIVIVLTAIALSISSWMIEPTGNLHMGLVGKALLEAAASIVAGAFIAGFIILYLRYVRREMVLFVVVVSLLIVYHSESFHLHFLLVCITAGFVVENFSRYGERLIEAIERTSMTVYVIFFAIAGATINFGASGSTWIIALAFVAVRAAAFATGTGLAGKVVGANSLVTCHSWKGYLGQAGVSLGIASLVLRTYPSIGSMFYTIAVASVAINEVVGPVALKLLLVKAGETAEQRQQAITEENL